MSEGIRIEINGQPHPTESDHTLVTLLPTIGLKAAQVVVELNGEALTPKEFGSAKINAGDKLEIINIVAGG